MWGRVGRDGRLLRKGRFCNSFSLHLCFIYDCTGEHLNVGNMGRGPPPMITPFNSFHCEELGVGRLDRLSEVTASKMQMGM